jgi:hypothetical protein
MKLLKYLPAILFFYLSIKIFPATIQGQVKDASTGEPLIGANLIVDGTPYGAATDLYGFYKIKDLSPGEYTIRISYIGYRPTKENVEIKNKDDVIELDVKLEEPIIYLDSVSTPTLEAYHKRLEEQNKISSVLKIVLDSLTFSDNFLTAYLSMTNCAKDSFYILKTFTCYEVIIPVVKDSAGKLVRQNMGLYDCMGMKTCPDSGDLMLIKPGETIKYPATKLEFYNFGRYPKGKYTVAVKYEFKKPVTINGFYCKSKSNIKALITGLRGIYMSNALTFANK